MIRQPYHSVVNRIGQYVHDHLDESITVESLAEHVGVSKYHINRVFHVCTGFRLGEFVQRRRMEAAYYLLRDSDAYKKPRTILDVALSVGYESHASFSRTFVSVYGVKPSEVQRVKAIPLKRFKAMKPRRQPDVVPEILQLADLELLGLHGGGFYQQSFNLVAEKLYTRVAAALGLKGDFDYSRLSLIGVVIDDPWLGDQESSRFFAGVKSVTADVLAAENGRKGPVGSELDRYLWKGGTWAKFVHAGPYQSMWQTISKVYSGWVIPNNIVVKDTAMVQVYINSAHTTPPSELETHIYISIETASNSHFLHSS